MLGEGMALLSSSLNGRSNSVDGIHIDMNHLKKGEVK